MRPSPPPRSLSPRQHAPRSTATPPRLLLWTAAGALLLLCALAAPAAASEPGRLGSDVVPVSQHTELHVDPAVPAYRGRVSIVLEAVTSAESFVLHAEGLEITSATLHRGRKRIPVTTAAQDHALLEVRPSKPLKPGTHRLDLDFTGELSDGTTGLYRFQSEDRWYVASQFEADEARRAFPCFDEPAAKATHRFSVSAPTGLTVVSNMPVVSTTEGELETAHHFATSPLLPTYVLALAIGPYESIPVGGMGRPSRVYTRAGRSGEAVELARLAPLVTEKLEIWFREKLPFPKMDFVALPAFDGSAMENAGAIFFHEKHVLFDPDTASRKKRAGLAQVLAHELAHQWFGNLVTMKWWDDLWLNEAFAEWMAHKACDAVSPDYDVWDDFQEDKSRALVDDALPTTHPIWTSVDTPDEAIEMFDVITYQKGCAVMRMLENYLGEAAFRSGLRAYMRAFAYGNAGGSDLWLALEEASGQPVGHVMRSWITVSGYPVLSCTLDGAELTVQQRRFFSSASAVAEAQPTIWNVPVVVRFEDDDGPHEHRFILREAGQTVTLPAKGGVRWCYANADEIGFYRTQPDPPLRAALIEHLSSLSPIELRGFVQDQWGLVRNGSESVGAYLPLLDACTLGDDAAIGDHNVLRSVASRLGTIDRILRDAEDDGARGKMRAWIAARLGEPLQALGFSPKEGESQNDAQRRALLIHAMARLARNAATVDEAIEEAARERGDPTSVDPNLAGTFLDVAARNGDAALFETWIDTYSQRKAAGLPPQACLRYLYTLASFEEAAVTGRTLALIDDGTIPQEAVGPVLSQLLGERHAQLETWGYVKANWATLKKRVGDMGISRVVEAVGALKPDQRADIVAFFEANPPSGAERALARALEFMDEAEALRQRITAEVAAWFAAT